MVFYADLHFPTLHSGANHHLVVGLAKLDGIAQQVANHRLDHIHITGHQHAVRPLVAQGDLLDRSHHREDFQYAVNHLHYIKILNDHVHAANLALSPLQQVIQQGEDILGRLVRSGEQFKHITANLIGLQIQDKHIKHHFYRTDRRTQVVSNDGIELVAPLHGITQLFVLSGNGAIGSHQRNLVINAGNQFLLIEGFGNKVVSTHLKALHDIGRTVQGGQEDDGDVLMGLGTLQFQGHVESAHIGHHHVKQNQVRTFLFHLSQSLRTVTGGADSELFVAQEHLKQQHVRHHIIYNQDFVF